MSDTSLLRKAREILTRAKWDSPLKLQTKQLAADIPKVGQVASKPTFPVMVSPVSLPNTHDKDDLTSKEPSIDLTVVPDLGPELTYCECCGGGCWIRETFASFHQCGRCSPSESRVETEFIPGGTPPPQSQIPAVASNRDIIMEPAAQSARAIFWETGTGRILGPATPEFLARDGEAFWVVTTFEGQIRWINADQLRSKRSFEQQVAVREVHIIREDHR